jgi:hypothetical protein
MTMQCPPPPVCPAPPSLPAIAAPAALQIMEAAMVYGGERASNFPMMYPATLQPSGRTFDPDIAGRLERAGMLKSETAFVDPTFRKWTPTPAGIAEVKAMRARRSAPLDCPPPSAPPAPPPPKIRFVDRCW